MSRLLQRRKKASLLQLDDVVSNPDLQEMVGDPDKAAESLFAQFAPPVDGEREATLKSPIEGDDIFFSYMKPGSVFQSHDGGRWRIDSYSHEGSGQVGISNVWYPSMKAVVPFLNVRQSIHSWIDPVLQIVPPMPKGSNWEAQPVRVVE